MSSLGTPLLVVIFVAGAVVTWIAGTYLSDTTDALDARLGLGEELGGLLLLAIAGSLPELAITVSAAASGNLGLAAGNLIGRRLQEKKTPEQVIDELYVRCLSRKPLPKEREKLLALVNTEPDKKKALDDAFWSLLNSREFMFNH